MEIDLWAYWKRKKGALGHSIGIFMVEERQRPQKQMLSSKEPIIIFYLMLKVPLESHKSRRNSISSICDDSFDPRSKFSPIFRNDSHYWWPESPNSQTQTKNIQAGKQPVEK